MRTTFFDRKSLLVWGITNWRRHVRSITEALQLAPRDATVVTLRSPVEVSAFAAALGAVRRPRAE